MPDTAILEATRLKPSEAISFFRQKINIPTERWGELESAAHAKGFAVAGATSRDLLNDFRAAVSRALSEGRTLAEFRQDFDRIVKKYGWQHTGSPGWRAKIIYDTNLTSAYAAGRYKRLTTPEALELYPNWQYRHHACQHPRPQHVAWDGLILPNNHSFWQTHYPPNGWRCHCTVEPVSDGKMERRGWRVSEAPPVEYRPWRNPATGKMEQIPNGIDPGFQTNQGLEWAKLEKVRAATAMTPVTHVEGRSVSELPAKERQAVQKKEIEKFVAMRPPVGEIDAGTLHPAVRKILKSESDPVLLSGENLQKNMSHHPELTSQDYEALPALLSDPDYVLATNRDTQIVMLSYYEEQLFLLALKTTQAHDKNYLMSLFHKNSDYLKQVIRNKEILYSKNKDKK